MDETGTIIKTALLWQTGEEWKAAANILLFTYVFTEAGKRGWRRISKSYRAADVWVFSILAGAISAFNVWPPDSETPWWIAGVITAGVLSFGYKFIIAAIALQFPRLASNLTGDRRHSSNQPPGATERRHRD